MQQRQTPPVCGQALPPNCGAALVRLLCCEPSAQDLVQVDLAPNAGKTQSTGHLWPLQVRASSVCGQALPPNLVVHEPHGTPTSMQPF